jgi:hypothetical protein
MTERDRANSPPSDHGIPDVPTRVFDEFIDALKAANVPDELVSRLRNVLLEQPTFTDNALKAAVLGEEPVQ